MCCAVPELHGGAARVRQREVQGLVPGDAVVLNELAQPLLAFVPIDLFFISVQ